MAGTYLNLIKDSFLVLTYSSFIPSLLKGVIFKYQLKIILLITVQ